MELTDIIRSVRRYWVVTLGVFLVFLLAGFAASSTRGESYEASALVVVSFAETPAFGVPSTDRYVQNQLVVFNSSELAGLVADEVDGLSTEAVQAMTDFEQVDGSDIIRVSSRSGSPEQAQAVANAYADQYVALIRDQIEEASQPRIEAIDNEIDDIEDQIARLDTEIPEAGPFAAALNQERTTLRARLTNQSQAREQLILDRDRAQASNRTLQRAELPTEPEASRLILAAALFVGVIAGGVAAVAYGRLTGRVLDSREIAEAFRTPVAAALPAAGASSRRENLLVSPLDDPSIRGLCVRIEAHAQADSLVVAVAGSTSVSGATTTAAGIAAHFGRQGIDTLLIDLDMNNPELSQIVESMDELSRAPFGVDGGLLLVDLPTPGVRFTGAGEGTARVTRQQIEGVVATIRQVASVVVIDCGSVLDSAIALRLIEQADVAVVAVPIRRQRSLDLEIVAEELRSTGTAVLPVTTPVTGR